MMSHCGHLRGCPFWEHLLASERIVVKREPQRRRRSAAEECRIAQETLEPGASVSRAHGVNAAGAASLLPVHVGEAAS